MLREELKKTARRHTKFRLRGLDNTRIEAVSDGVFALAIALLLISSDVPQTFDQLKGFLRNFFPFAATITLLMLIWYQHYVFFIRYGLKDAGIVAVNTLLLFLVLFYVYPLKFLFQVLFDLFYALAYRDREVFDHLYTVTISPQDTTQLMTIYGLGGALVFLTVSFMYWIALNKKNSLELNHFEIFETRTYIYDNLLSATIPLLSALIANFDVGGGGTISFRISGMFYLSYAIVMPLFGVLRDKKRKALIKKTGNN